MKEDFNDRIRSIRFTSYIEAIKMNTPFIFPKDSIFNMVKENEICGKRIELEGGVIVLPEDINKQFSSDETINIIKMSQNIHVWSIGEIFRGKYYDKKNDVTYSNKSLSVEVLGISTVEIVNAAENIAYQLNQKGAMVKTYLDGKIFLVDTKI